MQDGLAEAGKTLAESKKQIDVAINSIYTFFETAFDTTDEIVLFTTAIVCDNTLVCGNARAFNNAKISGNAQVSGEAMIDSDACVFGIVFMCAGNDIQIL